MYIRVKVEIKELKLEHGEKLEAIPQWSSTTEVKLFDIEGVISELNKMQKQALKTKNGKARKS